jgi:hypothetical protein
MARHSLQKERGRDLFLVQQLDGGEVRDDGECGNIPCHIVGNFGEERDGAEGIPRSSIWQRRLG